MICGVAKVGSLERRAARAHKAGLGLKAKRRRKRLKMLAQRRLFAAAHGPNLAAHIDEVEAVPRQFAECFGIARYDRGLHAKPGVGDLVTVLLIEMPHWISNKPVAMQCLLARFAASHKKMLRCIIMSRIDGA
jgi:hypothetical protein